MPEKRVSRQITKKEDIDYLLNLSEAELLSTTFIMETFGEFKGKRRFNPYDSISFPPNSYGIGKKRNKNTIYTTVGIWIFNKCFIEQDFFEVIGYVNKTIDKKTLGAINAKMSYAVMEDDVPLEAMKRYIMKCQKYMPYVSILSPSHTMKMLLITKEINKKKAELLKKYDKEIKAGDEKTADLIEKELLDYSRELLKDDPSMDMYDSGARGSFDNNFKNMFVMKGAIKDPDPDKGYNIVTSNYMDGAKKEDYTALSNSLAAGPYSRAMRTSVGGYYEKLFLSAFQHVVLDKKDSDCKTTKTISVNVTKSNIVELMYSFVQEGSKLTEITSKNMDRYIGKTVKLRFTSLCENDNICNMCAGNLFYRLGIVNVGTATPQVPSRLKQLALKNFHDSSLKFTEMNVMEAFGI